MYHNKILVGQKCHKWGNIVKYLISSNLAQENYKIISYTYFKNCEKK